MPDETWLGIANFTKHIVAVMRENIQRHEKHPVFADEGDALAIWVLNVPSVTMERDNAVPRHQVLDGHDSGVDRGILKCELV